VFFQLKNIVNVDRTSSHTTLSAVTNALLHPIDGARLLTRAQNINFI